MLDIIKQGLQTLHDGRTLSNRFIIYQKDHNPINHSDGCYRGLASYLSSRRQYADHFGLAFHGDGAAMTFDALRSMEKFNECMLAHTVPYNKFTGTERSKRWVSFLLSPVSPWRALHPYVAETDPDYINNAGFIFKDATSVPSKLAYNFALAIRYPWETTQNYELFLQLSERPNIDPVVALYISMNFNLKPTADTFDGPYDVRYPWSFLEEIGLEAVARFILGKPACVSNTASPVNPSNVRALWECPEDITESRKALAGLIENDNLMLDGILQAIEERISVQRNYIGA